MTQNYAVERQGGSPLVYGGLGAAVGAGGGAALAKYARIGIPEGYKSWDDAVSATSANDKFVTKRAAAEKDNWFTKLFGSKESWKTLAEQQEAVSKARNEVLGSLTDDVKNNINVQNYVDEVARFDEQLDDLANKVIKGEKIEGVTEDLAKQFETYKNNTGDLKDVIKKSDLVKTEREALEKSLEKAQKAAGDKVNIKDQVEKNIVNMKKARSTAKNALESGENAIIKALKKPSTKWTAIAIGAVGLLAGLLVRPKGNERA